MQGALNSRKEMERLTLLVNYYYQCPIVETLIATLLPSFLFVRKDKEKKLFSTYHFFGQPYTTSSNVVANNGYEKGGAKESKQG